VYSLTVDDLRLPDETRYMARLRLDKYLEEGRVVRQNQDGNVVPIDETQEERYERIKSTFGKTAEARKNRLPISIPRGP
jgi:hypothetical protein